MSRPLPGQLEKPDESKLILSAANMAQNLLPVPGSFGEKELEIIAYLTKERELSESREGESRIDEILRHLELYKQKCYVSSTDPYIQMVSGIFSMVISEDMEPEALDFACFHQFFMEHCVGVDGVDLATMSALILLAFKTLNIKVNRRLLFLESLDQEEDEFGDFDSFDFLDMELFEDDEGFEFTQRVIRNKRAPIHESVWRGGENVRRATLLELFDAVKEAEKDRREYERHYKKMVERRRALKLLRKQKKEEVSEAPVKDNIYADIKKVWQRILAISGEDIRFTQILEDGTESLSTVRSFFAILFLSQDGFTRLRQWDHFGDIHLTDIKRDMELVVPEKKEDSQEGLAGQAGTAVAL